MENAYANETNNILLGDMTEQAENVEAELSLAEIFRILLKGKWLIGILVFVAVIGTFSYLKFLSPGIGKVQTIISFNYNGIEKGLDPHGKNMDVSMIKSPLVLDNVVKALSLEQYGISSNDLRININITPIIPGNITEHITRLEEDIKGNIETLQKYIYYPNKYIINFNLNRKMNISASLAQQIVDEVVKQYQEYFYKTYSDMSVLASAIHPVDYEEYDYPEISTVIHNQLNIFTSYLRTKLSQESGSNFRSVETGLSFGDILESISIVQRVDLNRLDSIIGAYNLTKNKEKLIRLYEYRIKMDQLKMNQKNDEAALLMNTVKEYQKDQKLVMSGLAGMDNNGLIKLEETDEYYNTLTQHYIDAGIAAKESEMMILHYQQEIDKLLHDEVEASDKAAAEADVNSLVSVIKERIEYWVELTNTTATEYYQINLFNQAITRNSPSEFISSLSESKMTLAISAALAFMLGAFIVFMRYYLKSN